MEPRFVENGEYPRRKRISFLKLHESDAWRGGGGYREASMKTSHLAKSAKRERTPFGGPARKGNRKLSNRAAAFVRLRKRSLKLSHAANPIPLDFQRSPSSFTDGSSQRINVQVRNIATSVRRGGVRTKHFKFTIVRNFSFPTKDRETFPNSGFSGWMSMEKIDPGFIAIYIRFKIGFAILPSFSSLKFFLVFL